MAPLPGDPFADVSGALDQLDAFLFLRGEEAHDFSVNECRLAEVEHEMGAIAFDLLLNRVEMIFLDPPTQSQRRSVAVELGGGGGCEGLRIEEHLWRAAGLWLRHNELGRLLSAGERHRVDLEGVAHRPRDSRTAWNNQGLASEAEHGIALLAVPHEG